MVWLRHKGCKTPMCEYVGEVPLNQGPRVRAQDWRHVNGAGFEPLTAFPIFGCVDCGAMVKFDPANFESCDGSPTRCGESAKIQTKRLLDHFWAVFHKD